MKKIQNREKKNNVPVGVKYGLVALAILLLMTGGLLAKYMTEQSKAAQMVSAQFHISSDYLEEEKEKASYDIYDWTDGFEIRLFNYEKENVALLSAEDVKYSVSLSDTSNWTYSDTAQGVLAKSAEKEEQVIQIKPQRNAKEGSQVTVTVTTTAPFKKTLSATFTMKGQNQPSYQLKDQGDGTVQLTIQSNLYEGTVTVKWTDQVSPDNTNPNMESWSDQNKKGSFEIKKNTTCTLLFFKNTKDTITLKSGNGATIQLP